jgi:hypothetical protein
MVKWQQPILSKNEEYYFTACHGGFATLLGILASIFCGNASPINFKTRPVSKDEISLFQEAKGEVLDSKCWKDKKGSIGAIYPC